MDIDSDNTLWSKVFSEGPICIFMWENITGAWPVVKATPNVENLTGWTPEYFISEGRDYADLIHKEDVERVNAETDAWQDGNEHGGLRLRYRIVTKSGDVRFVTEKIHSLFTLMMAK